ncbi:MAG: kinase [Alphaproteobacteria bacterium]|nr:kinase [Alphaproteobacteria bacterium]
MSGQADPEVLAFLQKTALDLIQTHRRVVRIALAGPQGCGKSTLCAAWAKADPRVAHFSLDDVYLTTQARKELAAAHGALLKTRGPPGTHDLDLAKRVMLNLTGARARDATALPRYDKLADAPVKPALWPRFVGTPNIILVDGWCMGALPQDAAALADPVNDLEAEEDSSASARAYSNAALAGAYQDFFARFDAFITLLPDSFDVVPRWRLEQEASLRGMDVAALQPEVKTKIARFVQHFERITRHMIDGGRRSDFTIALDDDRSPMEIREGL